MLNTSSALSFTASRHFPIGTPLALQALHDAGRAGQRKAFMDTFFAESNPPTFTAAIRWRGHDPSVDLETRYPGFRDKVEAARFAAGACDSSPQALHLRFDGALPSISLVLGQGRCVDSPYDLVIVWTSSPDGRHPSQPHPFADLVDYPSACGNYRRIGCAVLDPDGSPVSIVIDFENADRLEVTGL
jgi:hypothetical protein